jgi:hypothetical protein
MMLLLDSLSDVMPSIQESFKEAIGQWPPLGATLKQYEVGYGEPSLTRVDSTEFTNPRQLYLGEHLRSTALKGIETGQRNIFALNSQLVVTKYGWYQFPHGRNFPQKNKSCFNFERAFYSILSDLKPEVRRYTKADVQRPFIAEYEEREEARRREDPHGPPEPPLITSYERLEDRLVAFTSGFEVVLDKFETFLCKTELTIRLVGYGAP